MHEMETLPLKRQNGLLVETVQDEVLVYDLDSGRANCLNQVAALVWENADGTTSVPQIAERISHALGQPMDERTVWYALDQLGQKSLMQGEVRVPVRFTSLSRREFMKRAAMAGALVAIPSIVSLTTPSPTEAATCLANGEVCSSPTQCCSGSCTIVCL